MIFNTQFIADWEAIRLRKQKIIDKNNQHEKKFKPHTYRIQDKVLVLTKKANNYEEPYVGPYLITQLWTHGNITIRRGTVQEGIKSRWIKTYQE